MIARSLLPLLLLLTGCVSNVSPNTYSVGSVGQVNRTVRATVVSARPINIAGTQGVGAAAGAAGGAVAGSALGGGTRANAIGAIGGAVIGGIAGSLIEGNATAQQGIEYIVQTSNGNLMTIVQGGNPALQEGQAVVVLYGSPARIIPDAAVP